MKQKKYIHIGNDNLGIDIYEHDNTNWAYSKDLKELRLQEDILNKKVSNIDKAITELLIKKRKLINNISKNMKYRHRIIESSTNDIVKKAIGNE